MHLDLTYICVSSDRCNVEQEYKGAFSDTTDSCFIVLSREEAFTDYRYKQGRDSVNVP